MSTSGDQPEVFPADYPIHLRPSISVSEFGGILLHNHQLIDDHEHYNAAEETWHVMLQGIEQETNLVHEFCSTDLPLALLEIMKDPKIYVWTTEPASPYHSRLERYTMNIYKMLITICDHMTDSFEDFNEHHRDLGLKLLQMTPAIWPILWENRTVLAPGSGNVRLTNGDGPDGGFSGAVFELIYLVIECTSYLSGKAPEAIPSLSLGLAEILIYIWTSLPTLDYRVTCARLVTVIIIDSRSPVVRYRKVLDKAVPDAQAADRIENLLTRDICDEALMDQRLAWYFGPYRVLIDGTPFFSRGRAPRNNPGHGTLRSIATACQRQLCSGSDPDQNWDLHNVCKGLRIIRTIIKANGPILGPDGDLYDLESVGTLCRVSYHILIRSVKCNNDDLYEAVVVLFDLYTNVFRYIDVTSLRGKLARFRDILRYCWLKGIVGLEKLKLEPQMDSYYVLKQWRIIGSNLGLKYTPYSRLAKDPEDLNTGEQLCNWSDCLCHETAPYHSLRVCTGCWKALYCSKSCQKRSTREGSHGRPKRRGVGPVQNGHGPSIRTGLLSPS